LIATIKVSVAGVVGNFALGVQRDPFRFQTQVARVRQLPVQQGMQSGQSGFAFENDFGCGAASAMTVTLAVAMVFTVFGVGQHQPAADVQGQVTVLTVQIGKQVCGTIAGCGGEGVAVPYLGAETESVRLVPPQAYAIVMEVTTEKGVAGERGISKY